MCFVWVTVCRWWAKDMKLKNLKAFPIHVRTAITSASQASLCVCRQSVSRVQFFVTPRAVTPQASPSMGISRQEYWSGLPVPSPGCLPDPGIEFVSPSLAGKFFSPELPGKPPSIWTSTLIIQQLLSWIIVPKLLMRLLLFYLELMVSGLSQVSEQFYEWNSFMYLMVLCLLQKTSAWQLQATWQRVAPKKDGSWWRVLTKHGPVEKGIANYIRILALRTSWTVWKGKKIWHWKMNSPGR